MANVLDKLKSLFSSGVKGRSAPVDLSKRFELLGKTGQGSMSRVYRARDYKIGKMVCLKILDKVKTDRFEARFPGLKKPNEGMISSSLRHKNLVQTFEFGYSTENEPFIVMELIDGLGLNFLLETHSPNLIGKRINYMCQAAEGLEYMHKMRYLHRDICPRNIMVTQDGVLKLIDFGLAVPYTPDFTKPGNRTGTPDYLAPELIKRTSTDHRVDLFALGVTAFEVFTFNLPWEKGQSLETIMSHINQAGRNPKELNPDLDDATVAFLLKAVERNANNRFQTAADFRDALRALPNQKQ